MKHLVLALVALAFAGAATAQQGNFQAPNLPAEQATLKRSAPVAKPNDPVVAQPQTSQSTSTPVLLQAAPNENIIGGSTYDLQTNTSVPRRLFRHDDGTISAVWTFSDNTTGGWPDRGTGYNFFDGSTWGPAPTSRIEAVRIGWPEVHATGTGKELVIAHDFGAFNLYQSDRTSVGSGSWTENALDDELGEGVWPRMAVGGANGQTLHLVNITLPTANGGVPVNGLDGAFQYSRSLNGGQTWDINSGILPEATSDNYTGFSPDDYAIDAKGDTVVIAYFGLGQGISLWKSVDNGTTWTFRYAVAPQIAKFDEAVHNTVTLLNGDSMYTADGTGSIILDQSGMAHVFWGRQFIVNDDVTDGVMQFYPAMNGIEYWNEYMGDQPPATIAGSFATAITDFAAYRFNGLAGYPSTGIDANGCLYMTYSAMTDFDNTLQNYRHIYGVKSCDNGCTWSAPIDLTNIGQFAECVYASMARHVDSELHFVYQRDFEPGISVNGDQDIIDDNEIVHVSEVSTRLDTVAGACIAYVMGDSIYCAGDSAMLTASCGSAWSWSTGETTQSIWVSTFGAVSVDITTDCGVLTRNVNLAASTDPPEATIMGASSFCAGDSVQLSAAEAPGATYLWSTGDTTTSIWVSVADTFELIVSDCVGADTAHFTVGIQPGPTVTGVSTIGVSEICEGNAPIVVGIDGASANVVDYQWYLDGALIAGATSAIIAVDEPAETGSYTVAVYNACGDSAVSGASSFTVYPAPATPTVDYTGGTTFTCPESATSYQWYLNGSPLLNETAQTFTAGSFGIIDGQDITVEVIDANGCTSNQSDAVVGLWEQQYGASSWQLYPNPTSGDFTVVIEGQGSATVTMRNLLGELVSTHRVAAGQSVRLSVPELRQGLYFVTVATAASVTTRQLVVQH